MIPRSLSLLDRVRSMLPEFELIVMIYKSRRVLGSFLECVGTNLPVVLVDNSYHEEDVSDILTGFPNVRHIDAGGNIGFSAAANIGAKVSTARYLIFMNPDTQPSASSLTSLVEFLEQNPEIGACGAAGIGTAGGGAQPTARRILAHTLGWHRRVPLSGLYYQDLGSQPVDVEWVAGSCMAIRREVYEAVGGFDPTYFIYMSDFDLGLRLRRAGFRQVVLGDVVIPHDDGGSSDLPASWTWRRRGRAWTRFLRRNHSLPSALGMSSVLIAGYVTRALVYALMGRRTKAQELASYGLAALQEWVSPDAGIPDG